MQDPVIYEYFARAGMKSSVKNLAGYIRMVIIIKNTATLFKRRTC